MRLDQERREKSKAIGLVKGVMKANFLVECGWGISRVSVKERLRHELGGSSVDEFSHSVVRSIW